MSHKVLTAANAITALRLLLLVFFVPQVFAGNLHVATALFAVVWALDGIDGFVARRFHQETHFGFLFDKVVDRLLIVGGAVTLLATQLLPSAALFLLTKDIGLLPALTIHARRGEKIASVGWMGKLSTFLQGAAVLWLLLGGPFQAVVIGVVACFGAITAVSHVYQLVYGGSNAAS